MLPGFRFLFAAIMLSMSLLVFGLGAAALLRAAHESFASNSSWRAAPEVTFAQHSEPTMPMLATLRVDTVAEKAPDPAKVVAAPAEPGPAPADSASSAQVAALSPAETPAIDAPKPDAAPAEMPVAETPPAPAPAPQTAATSGETKTLATTDDTKTAMVAASDASPDNSQLLQPAPAIATPADPTATVSTTAAASTTSSVSTTAEISTTAAVPTASPGASLATTKIATLGGPPVDIVTNVPVKEKTAKPEHAKDDQDAVKKRVHARRILHRRRLAARARLAAQQQLQANPFGQQQTFAPATSRQ